MSTEPTEAEMQAAWEEQLRTLTSTDLLVQSTVSLLNLAGRRLGIGPDGTEDRDLEQVRDAIDGARALMPLLERGALGAELGPLRDALTQLQFEYTKLASGAPVAEPQAAPSTAPPAPEPAAPTDPAGAGPAQSSGRLWVPGQ